MKFWARVAILFYVASITFVSCLAILFVTRLSDILTLQKINYYLNVVYKDPLLGMIIVAVSGAMIVLSLIFARVITGGKQQEKTIAFDNPSGRVSVSLTAVEDLVRRLMYKVPEIKEVRPSIIASKKGLEIESRLILRSDVNIPEMTSRLQELIKNKVQEILGLDETVTVRIHIVKIIAEHTKGKQKEVPQEEQETKPTIPFQGYRS